MLQYDFATKYFRAFFLMYFARINWVFHNGWGVLQAAFYNLPMFYFDWPCSKDSLWTTELLTYLGFRTMYILLTLDQDISLNWEYYPDQCPILLSTDYWDNRAGCNINDTRVQSHVSFILLELCARCIVPPWYIQVERDKELLSRS